MIPQREECDEENSFDGDIDEVEKLFDKSYAASAETLKKNFDKLLEKLKMLDGDKRSSF